MVRVVDHQGVEDEDMFRVVKRARDAFDEGFRDVHGGEVGCG